MSVRFLACLPRTVRQVWHAEREAKLKAARLCRDCRESVLPDSPSIVRCAACAGAHRLRELDRYRSARRAILDRAVDEAVARMGKEKKGTLDTCGS